MKKSLICALTAFLLTGLLHAQTTSGRVAGTVTDSSGAVVVGAKVTARNVETGAERTSASNAEGLYVLFPLQPGVYQITVQSPGFRTEKLEDLRIDVGAVLTRNVKLEVGAVEQQVVVSADVAPVLSQSASIESTIVREQIESLPLNGRDFNELITLAA